MVFIHPYIYNKSPNTKLYTCSMKHIIDAICAHDGTSLSMDGYYSIVDLVLPTHATSLGHFWSLTLPHWEGVVVPYTIVAGWAYVCKCTLGL